MTVGSRVSTIQAGRTGHAQLAASSTMATGGGNLNLRVRRASLSQDREEMLDFLGRNFGASQDLHFNWRHLDNPAGEAWVWFAFDQHKKTVATVAIFPRRMFVNGKNLLCGQVGGFAVDVGHRSLGPAVLLQRTTFEPVDSGAFAFCYDCPPNEAGMSTFVRLGMQPNCEVFRYALLLRSDEFLEKRLGKALWVRPVAAAANLIVKRRRAPPEIPGLEVIELNGHFGEEFNHLEQQVSSSGVIRASRSAELLNWRYADYPEKPYRVFVARRAGELLGFLVLWISGERAYVMDLFGLQLADAGPALLEAAIPVCRGAKVSSMQGFGSTDSELPAVFERFGFRWRDTDSKVVAYEKPGADKLLNNGLGWTFGRPEQMM